MEQSVFLALPHPGQVSGESLPGLLWPTKHKLMIAPGKCSVLTVNFNNLWCEALNNRGPLKLTHFTMHHSDIAAPEWWVDTLVEEMARVGADVLSAVVPLKDDRGLTTTAVGSDPDSIRRLTLREAHRLPETFCIDDIPGREPNRRLLINTGLWICRFTEKWVEPPTFPGFKQLDALRPKAGFPGHFEAVGLSEDWGFSQWAWNQKLRVFATRKLALTHYGMFGWDSSERGNWETDLGDARKDERLPGTPVPDRADWRFPCEVRGWLTQTEGECLADLARGKDVLEVGSYCGRSTICMAQVANRIECVDPFDARSVASEPADTLTEFSGNVARYGLREKVKVHCGVFADVSPAGPFDLVFIDGAHDEASVAHDVKRAMTLLRRGGLLAFHDYRKSPGENDGRWDPGVTAVVDGLVSRGARLVKRAGTVAVVCPDWSPTVIDESPVISPVAPSESPEEVRLPMSEKLYAKLGRANERIDDLDAAYDSLLRLTAGLIDGSIATTRVMVNLTGRSWVCADVGECPPSVATINGLPQVVMGSGPTREESATRIAYLEGQVQKLGKTLEKFVPPPDEVAAFANRNGSVADGVAVKD